MASSSLQDDLLGIPGVEGAEVDGSGDAPAGLRIRIAQGANQEAVGGAIRRVLSAHGLGTDTQLPGEAGAVAVEAGGVAVMAPEAPSPDAMDEDSGAQDESETVTDPEPQESTVIDLTDAASESQDPATMVVDEPADRVEASVAPGSWEPEHIPPFVEQRREPQEDVVDEVDEQVLPDGIARIESVAVVEGRSGITVTVRASDESEASQVATSTEGGVEAAVVKAAGKLVAPGSPDPIVVEIEDRRVEGVDIVMIVLDADGTLVTGSAVVAAGRPFALGRATWAALAL